MKGLNLDDIKNNSVIYNVCEGGNLSMLTFYKGALNHSPALIKRSLFDKYGLYDESLKIVSDWKFYFIAIGLNNEPVAYKDIDVTLFDMDGISETILPLRYEERERILIDLLPKTIYTDYKFFATDGRVLRRLKKNKFLWFFIYNIYRFLSKYDRLSNKNQNIVNIHKQL